MSGLKFKFKDQYIDNEKDNVQQVKPSTKDDTAFNQVSDDEIDKKIIDLKFKKQQQEGIKEKSSKKTNKFFYKVSNHHELFKIGRSFYNDYLAGVKSFAISSTGYQTSQQKSILGLASFFDHKEDLRIGIVTDNLKHGAFKDIVKLCKKVDCDLFGDEFTFEIRSFYNHFEFLDMEQLLAICNSDRIEEYDEVFDQVIDMYDVVFWDVPELYKIQIEPEKYFPVIMKFESISIIVAQSLSKKADIEEIKRFFLGYGINLKGLLIDDSSMQQESKANSKPSVAKNTNRPWWRKIFK